jgi:hypothetical protein
VNPESERRLDCHAIQPRNKKLWNSWGPINFLSEKTSKPLI